MYRAPPNVSEEIIKVRPDVLVVDGGIVESPGRPDLGWNWALVEDLPMRACAKL